MSPLNICAFSKSPFGPKAGSSVVDVVIGVALTVAAGVAVAAWVPNI